MKRIVGLAAVALALAAPAAASAKAAPYRTTNQAARYLETQLPAWAGVNLHPPANTPDEYGYARIVPATSAYCSTGAYSAHEHRTRRHFRERTNRVGETTLRSFGCTLFARSDTDGDGQVTYDDDERTFKLYLQTRAGGGWVVLADR